MEMKDIRERGLTTAGMVLAWLALLLFTAGTCSKKDSTLEKKTAAAAKAETEGHSEDRETTVRLSPEAVKTAGVVVEKVTPSRPEEFMSATAVLELNGDRVSKVSPRAGGRVVKVQASLGDRVRAGQALAEIDSVEVDQAWADYLKSRVRVEMATKGVKREETLFQKKVSPEKDLLRARQDLAEAESDLLLAKEKFRLLGVDVRLADEAARGTDHKHPLIAVPAPLSGVVIDRTVTQGEVVGTDKTLFTVADLSTLWLMMDIYECNFCRVGKGMQVKLSISAYPGKEFKGNISYLSDLIDEKTRTMKARVTIDNREGLLKPGMFATASIVSLKGPESEKVIVVPEEAVFLDGLARYVFIHEGQGRFAVREVSVGASLGRKLEIKEGLKSGEEVAIKGVFTLKSELKKGTIEVHEH
jgi:cobalt-zinc-cadmium efflux system membrane fusion protein